MNVAYVGDKYGKIIGIPNLKKQGGIFLRKLQ